MIAAGIRLITGVQSRWVGCEPRLERRIYYSNHTSHLDGPAIWACLPRHIRRRTHLVAARDYWQKTWLRRYCAEQIFHAVLIDRSRIRAEAHPVEAMAAALQPEGASLILFPEGTRRDYDAEDGMRPFKAGLYRLASAPPPVACVPVHVRNLDRVLPKGEYLPVPVISSVSFGSPIFCQPDESRDDFLARAQQAICALRDAEDGG